MVNRLMLLNHSKGAWETCGMVLDLFDMDGGFRRMSSEFVGSGGGRG